jgi:pilus assembly protein CpaE
VDLDPVFGDLAGALGAPENAGPEDDRQSLRTLGDLVPVAAELAAEHVDGAAWSHPAGFGVLLAPASPSAAAGVDARMSRAVVRAGADACKALVLHLARGLEQPTLAALEEADTVLVVLSLDVLAFRAARRALEVLRASALDGRCRFVVNRAQRAEVRPEDVRRVFGRSPVAVIPADRRVREMQDRGRLLPLRGGTGRAMLRLARRVMEEDAGVGP